MSLKAWVVQLFFVASALLSKNVRMQGRIDIIKFGGGKLEGEKLLKTQLVMYPFSYRAVLRIVEFK